MSTCWWQVMDKTSGADKVLVNQPRKKWKRLNDIKVDYSAGFKQHFQITLRLVHTKLSLTNKNNQFPKSFLFIGLGVARATCVANTSLLQLIVCTIFFFFNHTICSQFHLVTPATSQRLLCCLAKQYWGSDSRSRIIWILIIELPFGSVTRSSQHFVRHMAETVEDLWGSEKWAQPNKGMCGTSHPFLLLLAAIIVWKCRRQLPRGAAHSQTVGKLPLPSVHGNDAGEIKDPRGQRLDMNDAPAILDDFGPMFNAYFCRTLCCLLSGGCFQNTVLDKLIRLAPAAPCNTCPKVTALANTKHVFFFFPFND